jgi:uncharacterized membrane protein YfcA
VIRDTLVVIAAGVVAGAVNSVAGGGSLLSFPALLAIGLDPLSANVTNTVGLVAGQVGGVRGYRRELAGQGRRLLRLAVPMGAGSLAGAVLLLTTPVAVFRALVPWLIIVACLALLVQPRIQALIGAHRGDHSLPLAAGLVLTGVYGGYFGAALGVLLLAVLAVFIDDSLHRLNAAKVALSGLVNAVAAISFALLGPVHWGHAAALAAGSLAGGLGGAEAGRLLPATWLRTGVAVAGMAVALVLIVRS